MQNSGIKQGMIRSTTEKRKIYAMVDTIKTLPAYKSLWWISSRFLLQGYKTIGDFDFGRISLCLVLMILKDIVSGLRNNQL